MEVEDSAKMSHHPIYVLIDELKSPELERKKKAIRNIRTLAIVLGPEETRSALLKDITDLIEEKEVLMELLNLDTFVDLLHFVGGTKHFKSILAPLESLLTREDQDTREKAWEIVKGLVNNQRVKEVQDDMMEIITKLINGEWWKSKTSGITLAIHMLTLNIKEDIKDKIKKFIIKCTNDSIFHVRKEVAICLPQLVDLIPTFQKEKVLQIFEYLTDDVSDAVRTECVEGLFNFCLKADSFTMISEKLLPIIYKSFGDSAWRIRKQWVEGISRLFVIVRESETEVDKLWDQYILFLNDNDGQVKEAAIKIMENLIEFVSEEKYKNDIVPVIETLYKDKSMRVRKAIAEHSLQIWETIGKDAWERVFLPLFIELINDKDKGVSMAIITHLGTLWKVIDTKLVKSDLAECCKKMLDVTDWREKTNLLNQFSNFAKILGKEHFTEMFLEILKDNLSDRIYQIRKNTVNVLCKCTEEFGIEWFFKSIIVYLYAFKSDQNYLHRQTPLFMLKQISGLLIQ